jgi:hypothetical protein
LCTSDNCGGNSNWLATLPLFSIILNGPINLGVSLPQTLKWCKPLIDDTLSPQNLQLQNLTPFSYDWHNSSALIAQLTGSLTPCELASRPLAKCRVQKPSVPQSHSKTMGFGTYDHIASQMAPSSNSLDNYCYRRTRHMVDSYPNLFCTIEHKLSTCL